MMPVDKVLTDCEAHMKKSVQGLQDDLATIRTGRASPALIEHLHVEAYGVSTPPQSVGEHFCAGGAPAGCATVGSAHGWGNRKGHPEV